MTEPLATEELQNQLHNRQVSVVIVRFVETREHSYNSPSPNYRRILGFAASNEATGWNLRMLDRHHMVFHTRRDSLEPDSGNDDSGWVTFLVPTGPTYLAVADSDAIKDSAHWRTRIIGPDFIDMPRFILHVEQPGALIYGGTIIAPSDCSDPATPPTCSRGFAISDETALAQAFVTRYQRWFKVDTSLQTRLLAIPVNRTIVIPRNPIPLQ